MPGVPNENDLTLFDPPRGARFPDLLENFLHYLKTERSASQHTLTNYEIDLRHWMRYLFQQVQGGSELERMTDLANLRGFLGQEMEKYERSTVARRLSVIKGFLKFLFREGHISRNVSKLIAIPKAQEKLPTVLKPDQIVQMIEAVPANTLREKRNRAIIELLYSTGIRVSELAGLSREKVDFRDGTVRVIGKGNKERLVPMGRHCQRALHDYIDAMPVSLGYGPKTPLFLNRDGGPISVRSIQRDLRALAVETLGGAGTKVSPHTFRHSCATHLLAGGAGLREIQELLGHRSLVTTQKYTQVDVERLKRSYKKAHPKARSGGAGKKKADDDV